MKVYIVLSEYIADTIVNTIERGVYTSYKKANTQANKLGNILLEFYRDKSKKFLSSINSFKIKIVKLELDKNISNIDNVGETVLEITQEELLDKIEQEREILEENKSEVIEEDELSVIDGNIYNTSPSFWFDSHNGRFYVKINDNEWKEFYTEKLHDDNYVKKQMKEFRDKRALFVQPEYKFDTRSGDFYVMDDSIKEWVNIRLV